jgi:hypothetical protein
MSKKFFFIFEWDLIFVFFCYQQLLPYIFNVFKLMVCELISIKNATFFWTFFMRPTTQSGDFWYF